MRIEYIGWMSSTTLVLIWLNRWFPNVFSRFFASASSLSVRGSAIFIILSRNMLRLHHLINQYNSVYAMAMSNSRVGRTDTARRRVAQKMIGHWFGADKVEERERGTRKKIKTQRRTDFRFDALITIYVVQFHNLSLSLFLSLSLSFSMALHQASPLHSGPTMAVCFLRKRI